jgi:hypothetical protein
MGKKRGVYRVLVGKPEGKRPLGRPRHRREDIIKMHLQELGCGGYGSVGFAGLSKGITAPKKIKNPWTRRFEEEKEPIPLSGLETEIFQPERQSLQQKNTLSKFRLFITADTPQYFCTDNLKHT